MSTEKKLPAKVQRTGVRQLSISLGETQAKELERMRVDSGLRSWNQVIRMLIAGAMVNRMKTSSILSGWKWSHGRWHCFKAAAGGGESLCRVWLMSWSNEKPPRFSSEPRKGEPVCAGCAAVADTEARIK